MYRQSEKKILLSSNTSSTCPHNMVHFGLLTAKIGSGVWVPRQITTGFVSYSSVTARDTTPWVKKGYHPNHGDNFVNSWSICKILSLSQRALNFQQNPD